jgi:SMC interacting uncharacterized protein involved in chromosome segregation
MLIKKISIKNKVQETEKLKELISMEVEKLDDAKGSFQEDCEKFEKYLEELISKTKLAEEVTEKLMNEKMHKNKEIWKLQNKIHEIE